jgi:hypothetical protein
MIVDRLRAAQDRTDRSGLFPAAVLAVAVALLFFTAPRDGRFYWADAGSFALNGALVHDYVASGLHRPPMAFAREFFLHYPALSISLYPPVFPVAEAAAYAIFGVSQSAAQGTVAVFAALAGWGAYLLSRAVLPPLAAAAVPLVLFSTPVVLLWSRQIMMEVPSLAFLLLSAAALLRYQAGRTLPRLLLAVLLLATAVYTKQPAIFAIPAFAAALLIEEGWGLLRRRGIWLAAGAGMLALLPLAAFTLEFSPVLVDEAFRSGIAAGIEPHHWSFGGITRFLRALPEMVGWLPLGAALGYLVLLGFRGFSSIAEQRLATLMLVWFAAEYAFVTAIGHFEERYGMALSVPIAVFAVLLPIRASRAWWRSTAILAGGVILLTVAFATDPVPRTESYGAIADAVIQNTRQGEVVLFDLYDSRSLAFELRVRSKGTGPYVLRAEKILVAYTSARDLGITDRGLTTAEIGALIDRYAIGLVVLQDDFWTDQPSMARLQAVMHSDRFERVGTFAIDSPIPSHGRTIELFRNRHPGRLDRQTLQELMAGSLGGPSPGQLGGRHSGGGR